MNKNQFGRIGMNSRQKYLVTFTQFLPGSIGLESKIGGSPIWLHRPSWPKSPLTDLPMDFLVQIRLDDALFPERQSDWAYVFLEDRLDSWGTNGRDAVIFQSSETTWNEFHEVASPNVQGPIAKSFDHPGETPEYMLECGLAEDDPWIRQGDEDIQDYWDGLNQVQIGGLPAMDWIAYEEAKRLMPDFNEWLLLFSATCDCEYPLFVPSSKGPTFWVFVNAECTRGRVVENSFV